MRTDRWRTLDRWEAEGRLVKHVEGGSALAIYDRVSYYVGGVHMGTETQTHQFPSEQLFARIALAVEATT